MELNSCNWSFTHLTVRFQILKTKAVQETNGELDENLGPIEPPFPSPKFQRNLTISLYNVIFSPPSSSWLLPCLLLILKHCRATKCGIRGPIRSIYFPIHRSILLCLPKRNLRVTSTAIESIISSIRHCFMIDWNCQQVQVLDSGPLLEDAEEPAKNLARI